MLEVVRYVKATGLESLANYTALHGIRYYIARLFRLECLLSEVAFIGSFVFGPWLIDDLGKGFICFDGLLQGLRHQSHLWHLKVLNSGTWRWDTGASRALASPKLGDPVVILLIKIRRVRCASERVSSTLAASLLAHFEVKQLLVEL